MNNRTTVAKFSISIPIELLSFLEYYQKEHSLSSRSQVIIESLERLRQEELSKAYKDHAKHWQNNPDKDFWDIAAINDGLDQRNLDPTFRPPF